MGIWLYEWFVEFFLAVFSGLAVFEFGWFGVLVGFGVCVWYFRCLFVSYFYSGAESVSTACWIAAVEFWLKLVVLSFV